MHQQSVTQSFSSTATETSITVYEEKINQTIASQPETFSIYFKELQRKNIFNDDWKFYLGTSTTAQNKNFPDSDWKSIELPHDFSIFQPFTTSGEAESGFLPGGTGWYRKSFVLPKRCDGKRIVLNFDGVYCDSYIYVNGIYLGEHHYGYTPFAFDITNYVKCNGISENVIAVKTVNTIPSSRWYSGSGIFRDVTLLITDPVHVSYYGTYITTPNIEQGIGTVDITVEVRNDGPDYPYVFVKNTVYTKDGICVSNTSTNAIALDPRSTIPIHGTVTVTNPKLWSVEEPNLYVVHTEILRNNVVIDDYDTTFGFRYFKFDPDTGFYLNGKATKLNGVCLHHDQGALGSAAYYDAIYRQLSLMKNMGANSIRTSHNPVSETFIDICNEIGLLVIEEAFDGWNASKNGNCDFAPYFLKKLKSSNLLLGADSSMTWSEFAIKSMIKRDRNAPSIILWSLGNEIQEGAFAAPEFPSIVFNLIHCVESMDATRPTTIGSNLKTSIGILGAVHRIIANTGGIVGFNYATREDFERLHSIYGRLLASETASAINSRGMYMSQSTASNADGKFHLTSYDTSTVGWGKTAHESIWDTLSVDFIAGEYVWTGFDYIGEPTPWNGTGPGSVSGAGPIPNSSYFGIVDTTGFEKDAYYLYRSQWNRKETTLHLVTTWDSNNMMIRDEKTPISIFSNAPIVKLYRDDLLIGTAIRTLHTTPIGHCYHTYEVFSENPAICTAISTTESDSLYASFDVTFVPGTISAKAFNEDGTAITKYDGFASISTPDVPHKLKVETSATSVGANRENLIFIDVTVTDKNDYFVTTATNNIQFSLQGNGEIVGVDNGDQATTHKYQQPSVLPHARSANINAYAGKALVILRATNKSGIITLDITSHGLIGESITITTIDTNHYTYVTQGLKSYTMIRDYTVLSGVKPIIQSTTTGVVIENGIERTVTGKFIWEDLDTTPYTIPGDYKIHGHLIFEGYQMLFVTCRLHVIANVIALQNISTATTPNVIPTLPDKVKGITNDGTLTGEFPVTWEPLSEEQFATMGKLVTINGSAIIIGTKTLPVTASVRIAKAVNAESINVAPASIVIQNIPPHMQSDNLSSITNEIPLPGDDTDERWSNWKYRKSSDTCSLTFEWATAQLVSSMNLYYYFDNCAALPKSVSFEYSLNGKEFIPIGAQEDLISNYTIGAQYTYTFNKVINPIAIRVTFVQKGGTTGANCVALTQAEIILYSGVLEYNRSANLTTFSVSGLDCNMLTIQASSNANAGITILPIHEHMLRILTISEDGSSTGIYEFAMK